MSIEPLTRTSDDGDILLSARAMALIFGVSESQVLEQIGGTSRDTTAFKATVPARWLQNGRRRIREAFAAIGEDDLVGAIAYLERLEGGIR